MKMTSFLIPLSLYRFPMYSNYEKKFMTNDEQSRASFSSFPSATTTTTTSPNPTTYHSSKDKLLQKGRTRPWTGDFNALCFPQVLRRPHLAAASCSNPQCGPEYILLLFLLPKLQQYFSAQRKQLQSTTPHSSPLV